MNEEKISVDLYQVVFDWDTGKFDAYIEDEFYRSLSGDKLVFALFCEIRELRNQLKAKGD